MAAAPALVVVVAVAIGRGRRLGSNELWLTVRAVTAWLRAGPLLPFSLSLAVELLTRPRAEGNRHQVTMKLIQKCSTQPNTDRETKFAFPKKGPFIMKAQIKPH